MSTARECRRATLNGAQLGIELDLDIEPANSAFDTRCNRLVEAQALGRSFRIAVGRKIDDLTDERGQVLDLGACRGNELRTLLIGEARGSAEQLDVGPKGGERSPKLVAGVANKPLLFLSARLEGGEHGVELRCEATDLVIAHNTDTSTKVLGLCNVFCGFCQFVDRLQRAPGNEQAGTGGEQHTDRAEHEEGGGEAGKRCINFGERASDLDDAEKIGLNRGHPDMHIVDMIIGQDHDPCGHIGFGRGQDGLPFRDKNLAGRKRHLVVHGVERRSGAAESEQTETSPHRPFRADDPPRVVPKPLDRHGSLDEAVIDLGTQLLPRHNERCRGDQDDRDGDRSSRHN